LDAACDVLLVERANPDTLEMPMSDDDLTLAVLIEIRDEIRTTNQRVNQTNQRLDNLGADLRAEIGALGTELRGEMLAIELRSATRMTEQTAATRDLYTMLTGQLELRDRVTQCEHKIDELNKRVG